jgi:hypothetical protein
MPHSLAEVVHISPAVWPGRTVRVQPGDLQQFAPRGMGLDVPFVVRPWDNPLGVSPQRFYGLDPASFDPFHGAPTVGAGGGTVYFGSRHLQQADFDVMLRLLEVQTNAKFYAVFLATSEKTQEDRFLTQIRLVSAEALQRIYNVEGLPETLPWVQQTIPLKDLLWRFIGIEIETYGLGMSPTLYGTFGGDGDWAKEELCFGFMVENNDLGIYRLWSRAWLVTK